MARHWLVVMLVACSGSQHGSATADLVIVGSIFTGDPARPRVEALAIRGDRIVAIGRVADMPPAARTLDMHGRLVIPGINDAHVHEPSIIKYAADVPGDFDTITVPALLAAIAQTTQHQPAGTWLRGELGRLAIDDPALTRQALDRVAPDHPVWIDNFAGHALVLNTAALRELHVEAEPAPRGGFLGHDGSGAVDGWRYEYARWHAMRQLGAETPDRDIGAAIETFEDHALAYGITSVQALPTELEPARLVIVLRALGPKLRWHVMRLPIGELIEPPRATPPDPAVHVVFSGTKYFLDGTPIERGAALEAPYTDRPETSGRLDWDRAAVRQMLVTARASGDTLHLHLAGDRSVKLVLDVMTELGGDWRAQRVVIEHGDGLAQADFARAKRLGVVVVQNPSHSMPVALMRARLGDRVDHWMPMRSLIAAGIPFALGSDGPLNPFLNIGFATEHPTNPREALTREQALVAYTQGAAYDEHTETVKGRLVPGMVADLAVLSQDIFAVPTAQLAATRSVLTIVGGRIVYDAAHPGQ